MEDFESLVVSGGFGVTEACAKRYVRRMENDTHLQIVDVDRTPGAIKKRGKMMQDLAGVSREKPTTRIRRPS
jgi:hypothetical protein